MNRYFMLATAVVLFLNAADGAEKEDPLQGTWNILQIERGGRKAPKKLIESGKWKVVIKGNTLRISDGKNGEGATYKRDDSKKPHTIDLVFKEGPKEDIERRALGIYEIDGSDLRICYGPPGGQRAGSFSGEKGTKQYLAEYRAAPKQAGESH